MATASVRISTKLGGTVFGGVEFFTSNTVSVKGEARYHSDRQHQRAEP